MYARAGIDTTNNKVLIVLNKESCNENNSVGKKNAFRNKTGEASYKSRYRLNNYERYTVYNHEEEAYLESQIKSLLFHPDLRYTLLKGL